MKEGKNFSDKEIKKMARMLEQKDAQDNPDQETLGIITKLFAAIFKKDKARIKKEIEDGTYIPPKDTPTTF